MFYEMWPMNISKDSWLRLRYMRNFTENHKYQPDSGTVEKNTRKHTQ